ncbi:MAG: hypothetical protein HC929_09905 [Leptolyngbyaceae cyanobacterium SM2_5_2]|nr:hypothetical protein [Leptolyngbyaceae cyanobacterium SM2_5_2]
MPTVITLHSTTASDLLLRNCYEAGYPVQGRIHIEYQSTWQNQYYSIKQVSPIFVEEEDEIVVITAYTFYF